MRGRVVLMDKPWEGFDCEVLDQLHDKGFITDPKTNAKSVIFTEKGLEESQRLFERLFGRRTA